jgi:WD40 repeat protein
MVGGNIKLDAHARFALVSKRFSGALVAVPLDGSPARTQTLQRGRGRPLLVNFSLDPAGRNAAVSYLEFGNKEAGSLRIVDLATGSERRLPAPPTNGGCTGPLADRWGEDAPIWLADGRLASDGYGGLRLWDLATGESQRVRPCRPALEHESNIRSSATPDSRAVMTLITSGALQSRPSDLSIVDLESGVSRDITTHGSRLLCFALDRTGQTLVTGDSDGLVRVGPLSGEGEPHLLYGRTATVTSVAVSPDGRWVAAGGFDGGIRLWPVPEGRPLHTLPLDELLGKLRALTNLRVVPDAGSATGYKVEPGPFPGWAEAPVW